MSNPYVKCTVDQCTHYVPGDRCMAARISIYNEEESPDAATSSQTQCKSFHPRKSLGDMVGALHNVNVGGASAALFMEGQQLTPEVECFVNQCRYWAEGNLCDAANIHVTGTNAATTQDTDCHTFIPK